MHDRAHYRALRKKLSAEFVSTASEKIAEKIFLLPQFINSAHIAYYQSHENEVDTRLIIDRAHQLRKSLYLPIFSEKNNLLFYQVDEKTKFQKNKWGIEEPVINTQPVPVAQFDLIFVPVVAFDSRCHRIGRGAGCYDRALQNAQHATLIGLAYEFQKAEKIIPEKWDVAMNYIVTEKTVY